LGITTTPIQDRFSQWYAARVSLLHGVVEINIFMGFIEILLTLMAFGKSRIYLYALYLYMMSAL